MKKILVTGIFIIIFAVYAIFHKGNREAITAVASPVSSSTTSSKSSRSDTVTPSTLSSLYKDGSYTGSAADAYYGYIQVKAVIQNGKLTDVQFLQYPNDHRESIEINTRAMPLLRQEAISAQSAQVDYVTRATDTSSAFIESLSSALSQAKA